MDSANLTVTLGTGTIIGLFAALWFVIVYSVLTLVRIGNRIRSYVETLMIIHPDPIPDIHVAPDSSIAPVAASDVGLVPAAVAQPSRPECCSRPLPPQPFESSMNESETIFAYRCGVCGETRRFNYLL